MPTFCTRNESTENALHHSCGSHTNLSPDEGEITGSLSKAQTLDLQNRQDFTCMSSLCVWDAPTICWEWTMNISKQDRCITQRKISISPTTTQKPFRHGIKIRQKSTECQSKRSEKESRELWGAILDLPRHPCHRQDNGATDWGDYSPT